MCGRYACVIQDLGRWGAVFGVMLEELNDRYNIAPTAMVPVFTRDGWRKMRWGLVPPWSKEAKTKYATFNARVESFVHKPAFRAAWREDRRCLIPVSGYYEWVKENDGKVPYYIHSRQDEPLVFAGLWEKWLGEEKELLSCTIITSEAEGDLVALHQRMPVMIKPEQAEDWLRGGKSEALAVLEKPAFDNMRFHPVAHGVGNPRNQGRSLVVPRR